METEVGQQPEVTLTIERVAPPTGPAAPAAPASPATPASPPKRVPRTQRTRKKKKPWIRPLTIKERMPITYDQVPALDATALEPIVPPTKVVLRAIKSMGMDPQQWNRVKLMAVQELGRFMNMRVTGRVLLVKSFDCMEQVEEALKVVGGLLKDEKLLAEDRVAAAGMMAKIADAFTGLSAQMMSLAEKTGPKDSGTTVKPKNLPPTFALQVNVPAVTGAQSVQETIATSGTVELAAAEETPPA